MRNIWFREKVKGSPVFPESLGSTRRTLAAFQGFFCFCFVLVSIPQPFPGTRSCLNLQHDKAPATLTWPSPSLPEQPGQDCPHPAPGNGHRSLEKQRLQIQDGMKIHIYPFFFSFVVPSMKSTQALRCFLFTAFTWREEKALKILILIKQGYFSVDITHYYPHLNFFLLVQLSFTTQIQKKNQVEAATSYPKGTFLVHKEPPFSFANQEQSPAP